MIVDGEFVDALQGAQLLQLVQRRDAVVKEDKVDHIWQPRANLS